MPYALAFTAAATSELRGIWADERASIIDQCRRLLSTNPLLTSKARVKRLRGGMFPPYRLRVGDYREFYEVDEEASRVLIHGVVHKSRADEWLAAVQRERIHENGNSS